MHRRRLSVALLACAGLGLLTGCGSVAQTDNAAEADTFFAESAKAFSSGEDFIADADAVTLDARSVALSSDLSGTFDRVALVLHPDGMDMASDRGPQSKPGRGDTQRASVRFRFAPAGADACASGHEAGPVELTRRRGRVSVDEPAVPLGHDVRAIVRSGRFEVCTETAADFDGVIALGRVSFEFGEQDPGEDRVQLCHVPPGNPDDRHTITVGGGAVRAHLAHGDALGACEEDSDGADADRDGVDDDHDQCPDTLPGAEVDADGCACDQRDSDQDGVNDCDDECPDTPAGDNTNDNGCTVIVLEADAGPDLEVVEGETVTIVGEGHVVQGSYNEADLQFAWEQVDGPAVTFETSSPPITIDTDGTVGSLTFLLTVSTHDGVAVDTDTVTLTVREPRVEALSAGRWSNVARFENDTLLPWGWDRFGQVGDGSRTEEVVDVATATNHTLLALSDGSVWTFGRNVLVDGPAPVQVPDMTGVTDVATLAFGGLMRKDDGTVWGFTDGQNTNCELAGEAFPENDGLLGPMPIPGLPDNVTAVAGGNFHGVALDGDGVAWVWGSRFGCTPLAVLDDVVRIAAGDTNLVLFLRGDGTAWAMGFNLHGQRGNGTTVSDYNEPTQVVGVTDVVAIAAGDRHSLFVRSDGTLWAAGWNRDCRLGLEDEVLPAEMTFEDTITTPVQVGLENVVHVAGGFAHSVAVTADGTFWAWGLNSSGQLTTGTLTDLPWRACTPMPLAFPE